MRAEHTVRFSASHRVYVRHVPDEPPKPPAEPAETAAPEPAAAEMETAPVVEAITDPDAALREAVGASAKPEPRAPTPNPYGDEPDETDDGDEPLAPRKSRRRTIIVATASILVGLTVAALVFLGRANAERYLITCATDHVSAERGRAFPPWGSRAMSGPEWKPIALPPNAECKPRETDDESELTGWYLDVLVDRASTTLAARDLLDTIPPPATNAPASPLDVADAELEQALLLARAPERRDQRKEIERLQGDVSYWRASLRLRDASNALSDAAKQFDAASAKRPRHATDSSAWATFLRRVGEELHGGPAGGPKPEQFPPQPASESRPTAPAGVALPVEPAKEPAPPPSPPADAGVPTGGVLL